MKLVENAKQGWKWITVQLAAAGIALQGALLAFPGLKEWLPDWTTHWIGLAVLFGILFGRFVAQGPKDS